MGSLKIKIATEGVHSGDASGIIPETFRILRIILDRIDDVETGTVNKIFHVNIPGERYKQALDVIDVIGDAQIKKFPFVKNAKSVDSDPFVSYLNRVWRPSLAVTGIDGLPPTGSAGNVLRAETTVKLSLRLPPTLDATLAMENLKKLCEENPPYGAEVTFTAGMCGNGWYAPTNEKYLDDVVDKASVDYYGKKALSHGEGGSIPLMNVFTEAYPKAQFIVTGVLGPLSNAHGPNEFLELNYTKKLIMCLSQVLAEMNSKLKAR